MNTPHLLIIGSSACFLLLLQLWYLFRLAKYWIGWRRALSKLPEAELVNRYPWHRHAADLVKTSQQGQYIVDRAILLTELDEDIQTDRRWLALQRIGFCAPLLGVILSAIALWSLVPQASSAATSTSTFDSQKLIGIVGTLVLGVGTGALLALLNQGWSYFALNWANDLRKALAAWVDRQPHFQSLIVHPRLASAILKQSITSVDHLYNTARQHQANAENFTALYREIHGQVGQLRNTFQLLSDQTKNLGRETELWRSHSQKLRETANAAAESHVKSASVMQDASRSFLGVAESITPSINQFLSFTNQMPTLLAEITAFGSQMSELSSIQRGLVGDYQEVWGEYQQNWKKEFQPAQEAQRVAISELQERSAVVSRNMLQLSDSLQQLTGECQSSITHWQLQTHTLQEAASQLNQGILPALQQTVAANSKTASLWQVLADTSEAGVNTWNSAVLRLSKSIDEQSEALGGTLTQHSEFIDVTRASLNNVSNRYQELLQSSQASLVTSHESQRELQSASQALQQSTAKIQEFVDSRLLQTHGNLQQAAVSLQAASRHMQTASQEQSTESVAALVELRQSVQKLAESTASLQPLRDFAPELQNLAILSRTLATSMQTLQEIPGHLQILTQAFREQLPKPQVHEKPDGLFTNLGKWRFWSNS